MPPFRRIAITLRPAAWFHSIARALFELYRQALLDLVPLARVVHHSEGSIVDNHAPQNPPPSHCRAPPRRAPGLRLSSRRNHTVEVTPRARQDRQHTRHRGSEYPAHRRAHALRAGPARSDRLLRRKIRLYLQLRRRGLQYPDRGRSGGAEDAARYRPRRPARTSRPRLCRRQSLVYRRVEQGGGQLRSGDEESRLGPRYRPESDAHDLGFRRPEAHGHVEHQRRHHDHHR